MILLLFWHYRYVRCLKPNEEKTHSRYADELVVTQLRYSGMLDIVRIRKQVCINIVQTHYCRVTILLYQGYPVHVTAKEFLDKYRCLADDRNPLPKDSRQAVAQIMNSLKVPETEWQIGKTKVFLRHTVFEPLEEKRKLLLSQKMIIIQKAWRGYRIRKRYLRIRRSTIVIQKYFRGRQKRLQFLRMRRAAITIQAHLRGMFARELAEELRRKKKEEEERKAQQRREEEKRAAKERAEKTMEEAYKAAQKELMLLAQVAQKKAEKTVKKTGDVDLDEMFKFLAQPPKPKGNQEKAFLDQLTADLDVMFKESDAKSGTVKSKPSRPAPKPPGPSASPARKGREGEGEASGAKLSRTQRRQRRVMKKLLGVDDDQTQKDESFDPNEYPMMKFAEMYFNDFPKDTSPFGTLTLRRAPRVKDPVPKSEMLSFTKTTTLPTSMVHMHDPDNVNLACSIFKDICKVLQGDVRSEKLSLIIQSTIAYGIERPELRDEIFCQLIRQVTDNPREESVMNGWQILTLSIIAFHPNKNFNKVNNLTDFSSLITVLSLCSTCKHTFTK